MFPALFIATFAAAAFAVVRRLNRSGNPIATYSREEQDAIHRLRARDKKSPPA